MRKAVLCASAVASVLAAAVLVAQNNNPEPQCRMCPATYIDSSEVDAYVKKAMAEKLTDHKNFVQNYEALFDTICPGCTDINRPLVDDMLGSSE